MIDSNTPFRTSSASVNAKLKEEVIQYALSLGFIKISVATASTLINDHSRLSSWLESGYHGSMTYMERSAEIRCNPSHSMMLPEVRSILVMAAPYSKSKESVGPAPGRVARFAWGRDYHNILYKKANKVAMLLRRQGYKARCTVDTMPILERAWARIAGLGFIGKNCCLIVPGWGSYVFLSVILTSVELSPDEPIIESCGKCRICLDSCPTGALVNSRILDARRCISYLTGVHRGCISIDMRSRIGNWFFGCDCCQELCPYNKEAESSYEVVDQFAVHERWSRFDTTEILNMDETSYKNFSHGSAIKTIGRQGLARNAAIVLGNSGQHKYIQLLRRVSSTDPSHVVREAAGWAADSLGLEPSSVGDKKKIIGLSNRK